MKLKTTLTISVLALSLALGISIPASAQDAQNCGTCTPANSSFQLAQIDPGRATQMQAPQSANAGAIAALREGDIKSIRTCCPPSKAVKFAYYQTPGVNDLTKPWGLTNTMVAGLPESNMMDAWAYLLGTWHVPAGFTGLWLVQFGEMKFDSGALSATPTASDFTAATPLIGNSLVTAWDVPPGFGPTVLTFQPFQNPPAIPAPQHLRTDGTRYLTKITHKLLVRSNSQQRYYWVDVFCADGSELIYKNGLAAAAFRMAPGANAGTLGNQMMQESLSSVAGSQSAQRMMMGAPVPLTAQEVEALPSQLRGS